MQVVIVGEGVETGALAALLRSRNWDVTTLVDGEAALVLAAQRDVDVLIASSSGHTATEDRVRRVGYDDELANTLVVPHGENARETLARLDAALVSRLERRAVALEARARELEEQLIARDEIEAELRHAEELFRQLAETIDDVFWLADPVTQRLFYVSPAYEIVYGRSCESLQADLSSWLELVHPEDLEHVLSMLPTYPSIEGADHTFRIVRGDGAVRWIRARTYPVRDGEGRIHRLAGVSRDVTDVRLLEHQLRQAQKMEAVGRLAGGIAHDFNNVLSVILSYTSLVLEDLSESAPLRKDIEQIHRAGERATALTRQLLAFSRQQLLQPRVLLLGKVVSEMETMLRRLLGEDIELRLEISGAGRVHADPSQVEQIVMNFAVNARDAMPRGGTFTLEVRDIRAGDANPRHRGLRAGDHVMLAARDTGTGMDPETRERAFEPFFTTKETGKGTGLGLPTVFGIVKQSDGHVEVESEVGAGSAFFVYLPRTEKLVDSDRLSLAASPSTLRGSETILLVEDDDQIRLMSSMILQRNGYAVLEAGSGRAALTLSERFGAPIDLLVTDIVMPELSGRDLADMLTTTRPGLRVLYVSGHAATTVARPGETDLAFLEKPITPEGLLRKVREVLVRPGPGAARRSLQFDEREKADAHEGGRGKR